MDKSTRKDDRVSSIAQDIDEHRRERTQAPSDEEVALRAYEIYLARGAASGRDVDDWLEAERQLRGWPST